MIKLFSPYIADEAIDEIRKVLKSGCITQGPKVDEFEQKFCEKFNVKNAVSLNSGTAALETAYDLLDLGEGDEVITTPLTCLATNIPLLHRKVKIVWADIDKDTLCIDRKDVVNKITDRTKAIVQVHLGGISADIGKMPVPVVSDACQALGIFVGDISCCSFQAIKTVSTGDGGRLALNDNILAQKARLLRWFGIDRSRKIAQDWMSYRTRMMCFDVEVAGYKRHMNDITATLGLVGLNHYDEIGGYRQKLFKIYREELNGVPGLKLIDAKDNVCWLVTILVEKRDNFAKKLYDFGIETNLVQVRNDNYEIFKDYKTELPIMDSIENKYISLPIGAHVTEKDVQLICRIINSGW